MNSSPLVDQRPIAVVLSSEANEERAEALARQLLERRLVGCVSLLPVRSLYQWQGKLERGEEVKLLLKTTPEQLEALHEALLSLHSYTTPEWIVLSGATAAGYGAWISSEVGAPAAD